MRISALPTRYLVLAVTVFTLCLASGALGVLSTSLLAAVSPDATETSGIPWNRLLRYVGKFHVLVIHFPIALLVAAALGDVLYRVSGRDWFSTSSSFCVMIGAPSAVAAAALGWAAATSVHYTASLEDVLTTHQWLGTATGLWGLVTLGLMMRWRRSRGAIVGTCYQISLYAGAALVGLTAHMGGTLIYGRDHLVW